MGKKGRKFIDKRTDVVYSFRVGARSQRDPLAADETAPQGVLIDDNPEEANKGAEQSYGLYFDDDYNYLKHLRSTREGINWDDENLEVYEIRKEDPQANKKELRNKRLKLPSSAFESYMEEPIGLLNKAAPITGPCPELDPDIVAHLDDDYGSENDVRGVENILKMFGDGEAEDGEWEDIEDEEIWGDKDSKETDNNNDDDDDDDDEMPPLEEGIQGLHYMPEKLIKESTCDTDDEDNDRWSTANAEKDFDSDFIDSEDEARDEIGSFNGPSRTFNDEETKSHFTEYSLSSSVLRRNKNLSNLDEQFEAMFLREYNEEQIGPLDGESIEGYMDESSPLYQQASAQTKKQLAKEPAVETEKEWIVKWIEDMDKKISAGHIPEEETEEIEIEEKDLENKWDCESILSTYSNLYNHPKVLDAPKKRILINPATGLPLDTSKAGLTRKALALHNDSNDIFDNDLDAQTLLTTISSISYRPPGESPKERYERKSALKELRRERRIEKKINKVAFKDEKKRQEKISLNKGICNTVKVV